MITVRIRYMASLKAKAGIENETLDTECESAGELFESLRERHGFRLQQKNLRVAINDKFESMARRLQTGDEIIFIPPVAGG